MLGPYTQLEFPTFRELLCVVDAVLLLETAPVAAAAAKEDGTERSGAKQSGAEHTTTVGGSVYTATTHALSYAVFISQYLLPSTRTSVFFSCLLYTSPSPRD